MITLLKEKEALSLGVKSKGIAKMAIQMQFSKPDGNPVQLVA